LGGEGGGVENVEFPSVGCVSWRSGTEGGETYVPPVPWRMLNIIKLVIYQGTGTVISLWAMARLAIARVVKRVEGRIVKVRGG
jgi:hypothetical protein